MRCALSTNQDGFTLVEISIVMIIIGLLIGGTFGGMKLIENMQVNKTVQDLKAIESAALTFKSTFGRLPGDLPNTASRLPNCSAAPCATGGNGNRRIENTPVGWTGTLTVGDERFTFWSHLQAADLLSVGTKNVLDLNFGEGQPDAPIGGGYRMVETNFVWTYGRRFLGSGIFITNYSSLGPNTDYANFPCSILASIDRKMDDGKPCDGLAEGSFCSSAPSVNALYEPSLNGMFIYDLQGF